MLDGSYDELLQDDEVDCVYVGNLHVFRREIGERCLNAQKHVLLEKPFACNPEDTKFLIDLAKQKNLFIMEGMWTRFFPAVEQARRLALGDGKDEGVIGEIVSVITEFNFNASDSDPYPGSFFYNRKLGGGVTYLVAPYPFAAATLFFPGSEPENIRVVGQVDEKTGVDLQGALVMTFPPTSNVPPALDPDNKSENTAKLPG
jgi:dihydrodiol dehydrogenase / D-xylose 1-dehydrogenase (NADP)